MKVNNLFKSKDGWVTNYDFKFVLQEIDASNCDILYIHSSLNFGFPNLELKKNDLLYILLDTLFSLGVKTIIFPTYTFSFCNGLYYDRENSKTYMGLLNEYFRKQDGVIRSNDPLMSNALYGENKYLINSIGKVSCGENSTFDLINKSKLKTKFLFLGPSIGECFTYMHYLESLFNVPYRYEKKYEGEIIINGNKNIDEYSLFVRYGNVYPGYGSNIYENILIERGIAKRYPLGDSFIIILYEKYAVIN